MSRKSEEVRVLQVRERRCPPPVGRRGQFLKSQREASHHSQRVRGQGPRSVRWGGILRGRGRDAAGSEEAAGAGGRGQAVTHPVRAGSGARGRRGLATGSAGT